MAIDTAQIIPFYAHPHVHTVINDHTEYEDTVAKRGNVDDLPFSTLAVTGADQGIDNKFVRLSTLNQKIIQFGKGNYQKYGQASIQADNYFNGSTNVWFMRVLPDNATYANMIVLAHYRKGKILDDLNQETGKYRLEIKFSTAYATKPKLTEGARSDSDIEEFARSLTSETADPITGYMTVPLFYARAIGRGQYGNPYSMTITRDTDSEKEYRIKMYNFNLISNQEASKITNIFAGTLVQNIKYDMSTLISDVIDQYEIGTVPVRIESFEDGFETLYKEYQKIVKQNATYLASAGTQKERAELKTAQEITLETFDPIFGKIINTRIGEEIPYYRNYTAKATPWEAPALTIPNSGGATKPLNVSDWNTAYVGARVLVIADPVNSGRRWMYTVLSIDKDNGNIVYDEGEESAIDADQYTGVNLSNGIGQMFDGGHDGDFQEIIVNGKKRPPTDAEMKILLSREFVKAFRGEKDRRILSPARINLDYMFDANYNMTSDAKIDMQGGLQPLFNGSTILTDKDAQQLTTLGASTMAIDFTDINVKKAMYDLNMFRNRNGMTISSELGAGCHLHLDCNLTGLKSVGVNYELRTIISMFEEFTGRGTSIDLGYYEIYDQTSKKRVPVTVAYFLAKELIPHIIRHGINKPFVNNYAQLRPIVRTNGTMSSVTGNIIRDSFHPDLDLIDWDVKEALYNSRINYYITTDEGRVIQRAVQNTRKTTTSVLLEENNIRVLNVLKKTLEKNIQNYTYEWNDPNVRKGYTDSQMDVFRPWIGTMVEDIEIRFEANEWEQEHMIMHCYCSVAFRDIAKRIIFEVNINRPDYNKAGGEA